MTNLDFLKEIFSLKLPVYVTLCLFVLLIIFLIVINLAIAWSKEILSDWYAIRRTKGRVFSKTLEKIYKYNRANSKSSLKRFYNGVILHPPKLLRLWIVRSLERFRDKKK